MEIWQRWGQDKTGLRLRVALLVLAEPANEEGREERVGALFLTDGQWVGKWEGVRFLEA